MNAEIFAKWMRRQGHRVVRTESSYWYDAGPRVFQAFPYHWIIQPSASELRRLLIGHGAVALRYSTPVDSATGMISYHVVLQNPFSMETLRSKSRNCLRRGLTSCRIERIPFERMEKDGWTLLQDTMDRQGRGGSTSEAEWQRICRAADGLPGLEAWGAIVDGELAAAIITARVDDVCDIPYAQSHRKFLSKYVNNALFFSVSCDMLSRPGLKTVFCNVQSLDAAESVDEFKFRMNFTAKPVRQCVAFNPLLRPFANGLAYKAVQELLRRYPANYTLGKTEGMLRFYLQGRRPLDEQNWPECMADRNTALFKRMNLGAESVKPRA